MAELPTRNKHGELVFKGFPEFRPNLSPEQIFRLGSFGGTYWRPIYSSVTGEKYKNVHKQYPEEWFKGIPENHLTRKWDDYSISINKYKCQVGTTLEYWEEKTWIDKHHPYGWMHWYCDFYIGKRCPDDRRQIDRWVRTGGPKSRFRRALINLVIAKGARYDDFTISAKRRQTLQHWACQLTARDCGQEEDDGSASESCEEKASSSPKPKKKSSSSSKKSKKDANPSPKRKSEDTQESPKKKQKIKEKKKKIVGTADIFAGF